MRSWLLGTALLVLVGCGSDAADEGQGADGRGGAGEVSLSGSYEMSTFVDLTQSDILPDAANNTLRDLSLLQENPAKTVFRLLVAADIPIASVVLKWLPGALKDPFEGWFNDYILKRAINGVPGAKRLTNLIDDLASITTHFEVVSAFEVPQLDALGNGKARHRLSAVAFTVLDKRSVVEPPEADDPAREAGEVSINAAHLVQKGPGLEDARLDVGAHAFGLPIGKYIVKGMDKLAADHLGAATLRLALGKMVDCAGLAKDVSNKCVGPACVGHEGDVKALCEAGLDAVITVTHKTVGLLNVKQLDFKEGTAKMWDATADGQGLDGVVDRIDRGAWTGGIDLGNGAQPVTSPFAGLRKR